LSTTEETQDGEPMTLVRIHGLEAQCKTAREELESLLPYREIIQVPRVEREVLQSRGSLVMQTLRRDYNVALRLIEQETDSDMDRWTVTGEEAQVREAKSFLEGVVGTEKYVEIINVPSSQHRFIIGRSGSVVRNITNTTHCLIDVPNPRRHEQRGNDTLSNGEQDRITITGRRDQVAEAKRMIEDALKSAGIALPRQADDDASEHSDSEA
jgi:hypothetical protein